MEAYADAASLLLTRALRWHTWWVGLTENVDDETITVALNTDFLPSKMDAPTLTALVASWEAGALTQEDLYFNLSQGSLLEPGITFEEWQAKLAAQLPLPLLQIPVRNTNGAAPPPAVPPTPGMANGQGQA
jgi:hypothetical protein